MHHLNYYCGNYDTGLENFQCFSGPVNKTKTLLVIRSKISADSISCHDLLFEIKTCLVHCSKTDMKNSWSIQGVKKEVTHSYLSQCHFRLRMKASMVDCSPDFLNSLPIEL